MKVKSTEIICELRMGEDNPRNSEGAFLRLNDGKILFAYSRFHGGSENDGAPCDIAYLILNSDGSFPHSQKPKILVSAGEYENASNIMSVSLMRMTNGDIGLFYIVKQNATEKAKSAPEPIVSEYMLRRLKDEAGLPKISEVCVTGESEKTYKVLNNDRVLRTSKGRLIVPFAAHEAYYTEKGAEFNEKGRVKLLYSDDDGYTWHENESYLELLGAPYTKTGLQEPGIAELPSGELYLYARTDMMFQYESFSKDGGLTWTSPAPSKFTSPRSPMKIAQNPYNKLYYAVWNPIPNYNGRIECDPHWGRTPLVIAKSSDGSSFSPFCVLEDDPQRGFCYPGIFFLDEKTVLLSYCSGYPEEPICLCSTTIRKVTLES